MTSPTVLIAGAGPTGLTLALALARSGIACRIVDQAPAPSEHSKALGIQARTLEVFRGLGVAEAVVARGHRVCALNAYSGRRRIARAEFGGLESPYPFVLILAQSETERILAARLSEQGAEVERSTQLLSFAQDAEGVRARLRAGDREEEVRAAWLLGCDGAHSTVRHGLELSFEGSAYEDNFVLADLTVDGPLAQDELHVFTSAEGLLAFIPFGGMRYRIVADNPPLPEDAEATLEICRALVAARGPAGVALSDPSWLARFRIHRRMVARLRVGRVFLAGDAAHIHSPAGGQGMNTGVQDAYNLAWKLALIAKGAAEPGLLDSYEAERLPVARAVLRQTDRLTRIVALRNPLGRALRDAAARLLIGRDSVRRRLLDNLSELAVAYPQSPIVEDHGPRGGPAAGQRAPVAELGLLPEGSTVPLHDRLSAAHHTLLLLAGAEASAADDLVHFGRAVEARYGGLVAALAARETGRPRRYADASLYLVRPDGHIGFCAPAGAGEARLLAYLDHLFGAGQPA